MKVWRPQTAYALKQGPAWETLLGEVEACETVEAVRAWWGAYLLERHRNYPEGWSLAIRDACELQEAAIEGDERHSELNAQYRATMGGPL
jgi:hypothetical protein